MSRIAKMRENGAKNRPKLLCGRTCRFCPKGPPKALSGGECFAPFRIKNRLQRAQKRPKPRQVEEYPVFTRRAPRDQNPEESASHHCREFDDRGVLGSPTSRPPPYSEGGVRSTLLPHFGAVINVIKKKRVQVCNWINVDE